MTNNSWAWNQTREDRLACSFHRATSHTQRVMSDWTRGRVQLALDEVQKVPLESVTETLGLGWDPVTMVRVGIAGDYRGELILTLTHSSVRRLTNILVGCESDDEEAWSELQISAAMETGNIFASAYLNELSGYTGQTLLPTPPEFLQDFAASVIQQAVLTQAAQTEQLLIARIRFVLDGDGLDCHVVIILSPDLMRMIAEEVICG